MKKKYIHPQTLVVRLQTEGMIAASLQINSDKEVNSDTEQLSNKKEDFWGDSFEENYW